MIITDQESAVTALINQEIVALFQGLGEIGPRALGNRSILFDPRNKDGKTIVNKFKKRENYRPFAGTVLLEHATEWFDMGNIEESPHMLYSIPVKEEKIKLIPAIVHVDKTCRIQTVTEKQNKFFYNLIKAFYEKTNVPILLNTSLNLAGYPLVNSYEEAVDAIKQAEIKYLYVNKEIL
tara:strand:+ start:3167 stop:3703 length:537 start_codon:yes stop_codon:yes gene_type:complete